MDRVTDGEEVDDAETSVTLKTHVYTPYTEYIQ